MMITVLTWIKSILMFDGGFFFVDRTSSIITCFCNFTAASAENIDKITLEVIRVNGSISFTGGGGATLRVETTIEVGLEGV